MRGRLHPAITNVFTTHEVKKMRPHVKMLVGNYLTLEEKSLQSGGSPFCQLCLNEDEPKIEVVESIDHLISSCSGLNETRRNIISSMKNLIQVSGLKIEIDKFSPKELTQLTQFLLGTICFYPKFFLFVVQEEGGGGLRPPKMENLRKNLRKMGGGGA